MGRNNPGVGTKGTGIEVQFDVDGTAAGTKSNFEGLVGGDDKDANGTAYNPWETGDKLRFFITDYAEAVNGDKETQLISGFPWIISSMKVLST